MGLRIGCNKRDLSPWGIGVSLGKRVSGLVIRFRFALDSMPERDNNELVMLVGACHPSYSGDRGQEDYRWRPVQANKSATPHLKTQARHDGSHL
jgi:hypothetical protein